MENQKYSKPTIVRIHRDILSCKVVDVDEIIRAAKNEGAEDQSDSTDNDSEVIDD